MATPAELLTALRHFGLEDDRFDAIVARRFDASPAEFKAMDHILAEGGLTPGQLGDRLALTSGAVTAHVEQVLTYLIGECGLRLAAADCSDLKWFEIDSEEDLHSAEAIFATGAGECGPVAMRAARTAEAPRWH